MKKNNLEEQYRETLGDFRETPGPEVWQRIERSLEGRRKRNLVPVWWTLGGIAAGLALLLLLWPTQDALESGIETAPTVTDSPVPSRTSPDNSGDLQPPSPKAAYTGIDSIDKEAAASRVKGTSVAASSPGHSGIQREGTVVGRTAADPLAVVATGLDRTEKAPATGADQQKNTTTPAAASGVTQGSEAARAEIAATEADEDSDAAEALTEAAAAAQLLAEAETDDADDKEQEDASGKWQVGPRVAPVYFNSFGGGSPIDARFDQNPKSGQVNLSYGLAVSYRLNDRLQLRSGLHRLDYGYETRGIEFSASPGTASADKLQNIDYAFSSRNVVVKNRSVRTGQAAGREEFSAQNPSRAGRMAQQFSYLEIPLELQYNLVDRRFGLDVSGGFSSLFLTGNEVRLETEDSVTPMGEATNVNPVNLSSNIGLGMHYELRPGLQLQLEPVFRYHWSTFSGSDGNFNPYSLGVYSGLNLKF